MTVSVVLLLDGGKRRPHQNVITPVNLGISGVARQRLLPGGFLTLAGMDQSFRVVPIEFLFDSFLGLDCLEFGSYFNLFDLNDAFFSSNLCEPRYEGYRFIPGRRASALRRFDRGSRKGDGYLHTCMRYTREYGRGCGRDSSIRNITPVWGGRKRRPGAKEDPQLKIGWYRATWS